MEIGRNAQENWDLFAKASQKDYWFHLDNHPSPHVFTNNADRDTVIKAAQAVKQHSKFKNGPKIKVIYCRKSNLKKGRKVGEIIIKNNRKCKTMLI